MVNEYEEAKRKIEAKIMAEWRKTCSDKECEPAISCSDCARDILSISGEDWGIAIVRKNSITEIIGTAADPEAYAAHGVGVSWERSAPMYGAFKKAGYQQVIYQASGELDEWRIPCDCMHQGHCMDVCITT